MKTLTISTIILYLLSLQPSLAHGGRTDAKGCHHDKKTNTRHCHSNP